MGQEGESRDGSLQRIDKWLFFARMTKSRSLAQTLLAAGAVTVNGEPVTQASHGVRPGDRIALALERRDAHLIVRAIGSRRGSFEEAKGLYEDISPPEAARMRLTPFERAQRRPGPLSIAEKRGGNEPAEEK